MPIVNAIGILIRSRMKNVATINIIPNPPSRMARDEEPHDFFDRRYQHEQRPRRDRYGHEGIADRNGVEDATRVHDGDVDPVDNDRTEKYGNEGVNEDEEEFLRSGTEFVEQHVDADVARFPPGLVGADIDNPDIEPLGDIDGPVDRMPDIAGQGGHENQDYDEGQEDLGRHFFEVNPETDEFFPFPSGAAP